MKIGRRLPLAFSLLVFFVPLITPGVNAAEAPQTGVEGAAGAFLVKPYLQLGEAAPGSLTLLWHADDADAGWAVEYRNADDQSWRRAAAPSHHRIAVGGVAPHRRYRAVLTGLPAGRTFSYRVYKGDQTVFEAEGQARKAADQPYRFAAFGDCGVNSAGQKAVAYRTFLARPDFVVIPGDIVYSRGRVSEYREKFWPVYNADEPSPSVGAPLLRSTLFLAAPGNHDIGNRDLEKSPDGLAYFLYWDQPLNGPPVAKGNGKGSALTGPQSDQKAFLEAAGAAYPRMANFSFDYGNSHWTVIDANPYVDLSDRELLSWVERDLAAARGATWRFVTFHHPGFHSSKKHSEQQHMRLMAEVFEANGVDLVFCGHVHNYQRSYPLRFVPEKDGGGKGVRDKDLVRGRWVLDKKYDGRTRTRPGGVIYLVTGAGGADLYNPEQQDDPESWQEFTFKYQAKVHSLTIADVEGSTLTVRQVSADGEELDRFVVTK